MFIGGFGYNKVIVKLIEMDISWRINEEKCGVYIKWS